MRGFLVANCGSQLSGQRFRGELDLLVHRGPDETKIVKLDTIYFGFQRLAIQDLTSAGSQPMSDESGNILCFNGERLSWTFLSMEIFLRIFVENQSPFEIEDELSILLKKA